MKTLLRFSIIGLVATLLAACTQAPQPEPSQSSTPEQTTSQSTADKTLVIHYLRYDENYEPWNLWLWAEGGEGSVYQFAETDEFGVVATATIPGSAEASSIGLIVRTDDWVKDVDEDRFITAFDENNSAEVWLVEADPTIYFEEPDLGPKILSANIDSLNEINLSLSEKLDTADLDRSSFEVFGDGESIKVQEVKSQYVNPVSSEVKIVLASELDLGKSYRVASGYFGEKAASPRRVFGSEEFASAFHFDGELGPIYSKTKTTLRVWAPTATNVSALIYEGVDGPLDQDLPMKKGPKGTWEVVLSGDRHLTAYTYLVNHGQRKVEAVDPYVKSASINGKRGVILDMARTNPSSWPAKQAPFSGKSTDAIFYELHVRDLGMDASSGISNKGKFISLTESGTKTPLGDPTGIDAIVDLGVTHLQLLPIYDYASIDETRNDSFNWGYDPLNYNVPEGSYASDPADPVARVRELKQAISYVNSRGLRVVMDVVYNHVYDVSSHSFQRIVPGYFFRTDRSGNWANGTGVGNEVASERSMVRKFIVESASYWAEEYQLGGFRFDLMGIHDVETMTEVRAAVTKIDPSFLIIGEGWNMGQELTAEQKANQLNAFKMPGISHFNDGIRDGLKGSVFNDLDTGWATGKQSSTRAVQEGIVGQIRFSGSLGGQWGDIEPGQSVSYVEAHDNLTLHDKLQVSVPNASAQERSKLHRFASSVAILAQGLTFIHAGQEFERSKDGDHNSYKSSDSVNALRWLERAKNKTTVDYFKGLIQIRKAHPAFRMDSASKVRNNLKFLSDEEVISYTLNGSAVGDSWKQILVIHNSGKDQTLSLPTGSWKIAVEGQRASTRSVGSVSGSVVVEAKTTTVLYRD
jgi:pullulanase